MVRSKFAWVLGAALLVATALSPLAAAPASADTSTVVAAQQTFTTSSPACTFTYRLTETFAGGVVVGLQHHGTASCPGLAPPMVLATKLLDASLTTAGVTPEGAYTGLGFDVSSAETHITNGSSGVVDAAYTHPKTAHEYAAFLYFSVDLPAGVTAAQSPYCTQTDQSWSCDFSLSTTPAAGRNVGPDPAPAPVTQALTVPIDSSGGTCQVMAELRAVDATTLSYSGHTVCPPGTGLPGGAVYAYADRREASQLGEGMDSDCYQCADMTVSGRVTAVKGKTYTATFYMFLDVVGPVPPECTPLGDNMYNCEVSASAVF